MELNKLEKYKKEYKYFTEKIDSLIKYLVLASARNASVIKPYSVSKALSISEFDALFLLSLAEKEDLMHKKFLVYTKDENNPLGEFDNTESIPKIIIDEETGRPVYRDSYYVDIVYEVA